MSHWENQLQLYDQLVSACPRFERKGKSMPYTSANGHMFSILNKEGRLGIRFSKSTQELYFDKFNTQHIISYGAKMKGYILITEEMLQSKKLLIDLLNESYDYVMSLPKK